VVFGLALTLSGGPMGFYPVATARRESVGHWAQAWARRYPMFALATSFSFGALIGHFFWTPGIRLRSSDKPVLNRCDSRTPYLIPNGTQESVHRKVQGSNPCPGGHF